MIKNLLDWIETQRFRITPVSTLPTTDIEDGRFSYKSGVLYGYDATRSKWLAVQRQSFFFGRTGTTADQYLNTAGGVISHGTGYRLPRNACVTGISVQTSTTKNYKIHLRKNNEEIDLVTLTVAGYGGSSTTVNKELYAGDYIQCYLEFTGTGFGVDDPIVYVELAWRG